MVEYLNQLKQSGPTCLTVLVVHKFDFGGLFRSPSKLKGNN